MALQRLAACLMGASLLTDQQLAQAYDPSAKRREAFIGYSERHRDSINLQTSRGQVGGLPMCSPPITTAMVPCCLQISIVLLPDNAPKTVAAIKELAEAPSCSGCRFYRSEIPPEVQA